MRCKTLFAAVACFVAYEINTVANEKRDEKTIDGAQFVGKIIAKAKWCTVRYGDYFVANVASLDKPLQAFAKNLNKLEDKQFREGRGQPGAPDYLIKFYAGDGEKATHLGDIGYWVLGRGFMFVQTPNMTGYMRVPHDEVMQMLKAIEPALHDIDNALKGLDAKDLRLVQGALESLAQKCFREHAKQKALPRMELFLSNKDAFTREIAAENILTIDPSHKQAQRVKEKQKNGS